LTRRVYPERVQGIKDLLRWWWGGERTKRGEEQVVMLDVRAR
jgi:hypothetical protein